VTHEPQDTNRVNGAGGRRRTAGSAWYLLFLIPFAGTLIPPIYNTKDPTLIGIPFFYWYLMAWVLVSVGIMAVVNLFTADDR
jgi:hypothetical protein